MDTPVRPASETDPRRGSMRRPLLWLGGIVTALCVVFGVTTLRSRARYREYKDATLQAGRVPWDTSVPSVEDCVAFSTAWAMDCPGPESWCGNEAPVITRRCLQAGDRAAYCREQGDEVDSTRFGYARCEALREDVTGRYAKRNHKKFCAAAYRAVAAHCETLGSTPGS